MLANRDFGCLVTEAGGGYTWAGNSQMNRLTPWSRRSCQRSAVQRIVYLRDEETGEFWTPTPAPCGVEATTVVRHGQGYSRFARTSYGLEQDLLILISPAESVKLFHLRLKNTGERPRRLSATFYVEWVLGIQRDQAPLQVVCAVDPGSGALFATNVWAGEFAGRVALADVSRRPRSFATSRAEFLGREECNGAGPGLFMFRRRLSDRAGELGDPCAAIMTSVELSPGGTEEIVFVLGQAETREEARRLARHLRQSPAALGSTLEEVQALWNRVLGAIQVSTPEPAKFRPESVEPMVALSGTRLPDVGPGRASIGQAELSGSATSFQDSMALVYGASREARAQILRAAARQFEEGDVQHWWHPPAGKWSSHSHHGADLYFLPFVTCHYFRVTGDAATSLMSRCHSCALRS